MLSTVQQNFCDRLERVPVHGLGLSVDVYSPDLSSLLGSLQRRQVPPAYLEIFQAAPAALAAVKQQSGGFVLAYHGEGLWLTQPNAIEDPAFGRDVLNVAGQLRILESAWSNHECATKQMAGYSFGTYLPPLYTPAVAEVVAANARFVQARLDRTVHLAGGGSPLLLLEMPPLTYFSAGTVPIPEFFRYLTDRAPCGLVLDMGHLWTVYRYGGSWKGRALTRFVKEFLDVFPLERVVEIHVAGLAVHESNLTAATESMNGGRGNRLPLWTDAHMAPIPAVLFEMLDQALNHPRLTRLRGLALEVDTKPIERVVEEFELFRRRYNGVLSETGPPAATGQPSDSGGESIAVQPVSVITQDEVRDAYDRYARVVSGCTEPFGEEWTGPCACLDDLERYRTVYLPYEILTWGGEVEAMFPEVCRHLAGRAIPLSRFVSFWFREPRDTNGSYDFFLIKIERFLEFVREVAPDLDSVTAREADVLRQAYASANEPAVSAASEAR